MKKSILPILLLAAAGCSTTDELPSRPSPPPTPTPDAYADVKADASPRITGPGVDMRYNDGGVFIVENDDSSVEWHDLNTSASFIYHPATRLLSVNGKAIGFTEADTIKATSTTLWVVFHPSEIIFVTDIW